SNGIHGGAPTPELNRPGGVQNFGRTPRAPCDDTCLPRERFMQGHPTPEKILQTGTAFWASKTLLSAVEMGLFTELAKGPERFEALRGRLGLHARGARDFLDALVSLGFLEREAD